MEVGTSIVVHSKQGFSFKKKLKRGQKLIVKLWRGITSLVPTPHIVLTSSKVGK